MIHYHFFGLGSSLIINIAIPALYFGYLYFKTIHRLNYHLGSLSGALPLLGGWMAADSVLNFQISQNYLQNPLLISIPIISTLYMWAWQNIHFAFIVQRYLSDYQNINYKLDKSLVDHNRMFRSMNLFVMFNFMIMCILISAFFIDQKDATFENKFLDHFISKVNIQNMTSFCEKNVFSQIIGEIPFLGMMMYFGVYKYSILMSKFLRIRKEDFNIEKSLKQFSRLRTLNYKLILFFYFNLLILNGVIFQNTEIQNSQ